MHRFISFFDLLGIYDFTMARMIMNKNDPRGQLADLLLLAAREGLLVMHLNGTPGVCQRRGIVEIVVVHGNKS
jgi:hypothetical protein